jgi:hypothetical protein
VGGRRYGWGVKRERNGHQADRGAERARWIQKDRTSGLSLKEFAGRHRLSPGQLHYWVYGSTRRNQTAVSVPVFQEVRLSGPAATSRGWIAEVGLPDGTTVRLVQGADLDWTRALVECLRQPCS